jgi:hypothetical protein
MTSAGADGVRHLGEVVHRVTEVNPCRRLQAVAVLLAVVGVLGLTVAVGNYVRPSGEGLGDLLDEPKADVLGQVKTADGTPVPGARVTDEGSGGSSVTGLSGWYFIEDVPTGRVELRMVAEGYRTVVLTVSVERGESVVDIVAEPGAGEVVLEGSAVPRAGDPVRGSAVIVVAIAAASVVTLLAAYMAYTHTRYFVVLTGALAGLLTWGWYVGSAAALLALVLVLPLRREFRDNPQECSTPWKEEPPPPIEVPDDEGEESGAPREEALEVTEHQGPAPGQDGTGGMRPGQ